jgi:hypothetical protein
MRSKGKKGSGTPAGAVFHVAALILFFLLRLRRRVGRGTAARETSRARLPAFHRGACCSEPTPQLRSRTRFLGRGFEGRYPSSTCPSPATKSQTGRRAGRAFSRNRPGAGVTSPHPREPLPTPANRVTGWWPSWVGRHFVTVIVTIVKVSSLN